MTVFQGRKRRGNIRGKRGRGGGPGIGFNLLWLEFQNTRWLMHIAFGSVPTSLCGRTSATFPSIPPLPLISRSRRPSPPPSLSPRRRTDVNSFCHRISVRPRTTLPTLLFSPPLLRFFELFGSNDIYAALIGRRCVPFTCVIRRTVFVTVAPEYRVGGATDPGSRSCEMKSHLNG